MKLPIHTKWEEKRRPSYDFIIPKNNNRVQITNYFTEADSYLTLCYSETLQILGNWIVYILIVDSQCRSFNKLAINCSGYNSISILENVNCNMPIITWTVKCHTIDSIWQNSIFEPIALLNLIRNYTKNISKTFKYKSTLVCSSSFSMHPL